jgi:Domain of unknown function (DUF5667)
MEPQQEHHANQLEELLSSHSGQNSAHMRPVVPDDMDSEVREMAMLAQHLQTSPSLIPDPAFVRRLERNILAHRVDHLQTNELHDKRHRLTGKVRVSHVHFVSAMLLFCLLIGTSIILMKAATISNPDNPLYGVKVWEQQVQLSLASSSQSRADVRLDITRDRLNTIPGLTDISHASAYQQTLEDIKQQIDTVTSIIDTLPAGSDRQNLSTELARLKTDIRHTLYSVLLKIPLAEQLATSTMLGQLGMPVPSIQSVTMVVTTHPTSLATVTIIGTNLTDTTHLIVNNHTVTSVCELQNDSYTFTIPWQDKNPPTVIAVSNTDGTSAQTTSITFVYIDRNNNSGDNQQQSSGDNPQQGNGDNQQQDNGGNQQQDNGNNQQHGNGNNQQHDNGNN